MKPATLVRSFLAALLGLALVAGLFKLTGITLATLDDMLARLRWLPFAGMTLCSLLYVIFGAMKWHLIAGAPGPRRFFYTYYTAQAMLLGLFLPVPVAIAVNRAAVMKLKQNTSVKKGLLNAVYDLGFDFFVAAVLVPVSLLQLYYNWSFGLWCGLGALALLAAGGVAMLVPQILPKRLLAKPWLAQERARALLSSRLIGLMMLLSTARFVVFVVRFALTATAIGLAIPFSVLAYATPPATMSALIALTPANLGIAEWSWTYLLTLWGIPAATGALYSVGFRILLIAMQMIVSGLCWAPYYFSLSQKQKKQI
jgi:hypothetical protein